MSNQSSGLIEEKEADRPPKIEKKQTNEENNKTSVDCLRTTLTANSLNSPVKGHRLDDCVFKSEPYNLLLPARNSPHCSRYSQV